MWSYGLTHNEATLIRFGHDDVGSVTSDVYGDDVVQEVCVGPSLTILKSLEQGQYSELRVVTAGSG